MKYPPSHYPPSAIQHTCAYTALTITGMCVELYKAGGPCQDDKWAAKIKRRISSCTGLIRKKTLSAGAKRSMSNCALILGEYIDPMTNMKSERRLFQWAALVWCALTFIEDVCCTCPQYVTGAEEQKWDKLRAALDEYAEELKSAMPTIDELGTYIYERAAWALEDVHFHDPEREKIFSV